MAAPEPLVVGVGLVGVTGHQLGYLAFGVVVVLQTCLNLRQDRDNEYLFCLCNGCRVKLKFIYHKFVVALREENVFGGKQKGDLSQSSILHLDILILLLQLSKRILQFVDFQQAA